MLKNSLFNSDKDPLNETRLLTTNDFVSNSFKEANKKANKLLKKMKKSKIKSSNNLSLQRHYSPSPVCCDSTNVNLRHSRNYPWLFSYQQYLKDLDEELYWLRVRSKYLDNCAC
jgi:hypothetical protein